MEALNPRPKGLWGQTCILYCSCRDVPSKEERRRRGIIPRNGSRGAEGQRGFLPDSGFASDASHWKLQEEQGGWVSDSGLPGTAHTRVRNVNTAWQGLLGRHTADLRGPRAKEQWSPGWTAVEEWPESPSV